MPRVLGAPCCRPALSAAAATLATVVAPRSDGGGRRSSSSSSSHGSSHKQKQQQRDYRGPLLVGGSLVGASTIQYYLHHRAFSSPAVLGQSHAHTQLKTALAASAGTPTVVPASSAAAAFSSTSSVPAPAGPAALPVRQVVPAAVAAPTRPLATSAKRSPLEGLHITIYQYKICPFCCKVKAVLDYHNIPYETLDVNPLTKAEIKPFSPDYKKVPIAKFEEEVVRDSAVIVNKISELLRQAQVVPVKELDAFFSPEATRWAEWADMKLAVLLFPNITRTFGESYQAFSYVQDVPHFSLLDKWSNQWVGATAMWAAQGKIKKKYNITDERAALFAAIEDWTSEVGDKPFLSGNTPNLGDLCVYACIRAIEGMDAHKDLMANTGIAAWYTRVENAIGAVACVKAE